MANDAETDFSEILSSWQGECLQVKVNASNGTFQHGSNFKSINEEIAWRTKNPGKIRGVETGYHQLDMMLDGLQPQYHIIGARPSVGKTAVLCDMTSAICTKGGSALIFSLEMKADKIRQRMITSTSRVPISGFQDRPYTITELNSITKAQNDIQKWSWWINENPATTISDIESQSISMFRELGKIDFIGVDYIGIVKVVGSNPKFKRLEVDDISARLKALGKTIDCPMVVLSQMTRQEGVYNKELGRTLEKRPELSSLKESGGLEADADVAILLHRDIRYEPEKAEFIVAKNRNGRTGDIQMTYNPQLTTFRDQ